MRRRQAAPRQRPSLSFGESRLRDVAAVATTNFADRLADAVERKRSQLVVGLDPRPDLLPVELRGEANLGRAEAADACSRFCRGLVDAVAPYVVAVKPQVAFFEALGSEWGAELVGEHGLSSVGAVIGATHPRAVGEARRLLPRSILLLPGVGAQGATPADVARAFTSGPASALVNVARNVIYAFRVSGMDWRSAAAAEASKYAREVWSVSGW